MFIYCKLCIKTERTEEVWTQSRLKETPNRPLCAGHSWAQSALTEHQEEFQASVTTQINHLAGQLHKVLTHQGTAPSATPPAKSSVAAPTISQRLPASALASPEKFSRDSGDSRTFLVQCDLYFKPNLVAFVSDQAKVAFIVSHLTDRAAAWATSEWCRDSNICQ